MVIVEFNIPVYFIQEFKRKQPKTHFVGMNWYRNAHFSVQSLLKSHYHNLIAKLLEPQPMPTQCPLLGYKMSYTYYYKNIQSDLGNVCALASKISNDALQELGYVVDDNVQHLQEEHYYVGGRDSSNPRVHVVLETIK
jgi:hypothetical protein